MAINKIKDSGDFRPESLNAPGGGTHTSYYRTGLPETVGAGPQGPPGLPGEPGAPGTPGAPGAPGADALSDLGFQTRERPTPLAANSLLNGLVSYWKFDEGTGTIAFDSTASNLDLNARPVDANVFGLPSWTTVVPTVLFTDGFAAHFTKLDRSGMIVNDPTNTIGTGLTNQFTLSIWLKIHTTTNGLEFPITKGVWPSAIYYGFWIDSLKVHTRLATTGNTFGDIVSSTTLVVGQWYHVVQTYDGVNQKLYINGVLEGTLAQTGTMHPDMDSHPLRIGLGANVVDIQNFPSNVDVDDTRIYHRAISTTEITDLAAGNNFSAGGNVVTMFGLSKLIIPGTEEVFVNGVLQSSPEDYSTSTISGKTEVNFVSAPVGVIQVNFRYLPSLNP